MPDYVYIDTQSEFNALCTRLNQPSPNDGDHYIALDTEFMRDKSYYSKLALLQICNHDSVTIIDPVALDNMKLLSDLLINPGITKVFHAGTQDIEIFYQLLGITPQNLFDTQVAATALGMGNQIGYGDLVRQMLGKSLSKSHTRTNWLDRPLKPGPLEYAADDVIYLYQLYPLLRKQLQALDREHWLQDDFDSLANPQQYEVQFDSLWRRVKGHQRLRGVQLAILDAVVRWREQIAINKDRPRKFILKDEVVLDLCRQKPVSIQQCKAIRNFPGKLPDSQVMDLVNAIKDAQNKPPESWPRLPEFHKLNKQQEAVADTLMAIMKWAALRNNISTDTLGTRKDIELLVKAEALDQCQSPLLKGWRLENAGRYMLDFLTGKASLSIKNSRLEWSSTDKNTSG